MRSYALALVFALPVLAACSGGEDAAEGAALSAQDVDKKWQADAEEALGAEVDLETLKRQAAVDCQRTDVANWVVTLGTSGDTTTSDVTRVGLQHLCPPVEDVFAQALQEIEDAPDVNALVCCPARRQARLRGADEARLHLLIGGWRGFVRAWRPSSTTGGLGRVRPSSTTGGLGRVRPSSTTGGLG